MVRQLLSRHLPSALVSEGCPATYEFTGDPIQQYEQALFAIVALETHHRCVANPDSRKIVRGRRNSIPRYGPSEVRLGLGDEFMILHKVLRGRTAQLSDRSRQGRRSARGAPELSPDIERRSGAAVRLHRLVEHVNHSRLLHMEIKMRAATANPPAAKNESVEGSGTGTSGLKVKSSNAADWAVGAWLMRSE